MIEDYSPCYQVKEDIENYFNTRYSGNRCVIYDCMEMKKPETVEIENIKFEEDDGAMWLRIKTKDERTFDIAFGDGYGGICLESEYDGRWQD